VEKKIKNDQKRNQGNKQEKSKRVYYRGEEVHTGREGGKSGTHDELVEGGHLNFREKEKSPRRVEEERMIAV